MRFADPDVDMDAEEDVSRSKTRSNSSMKKAKANKAARIEKKRHRKVKNSIVFPKHHKKPNAKKR